MPRRMPADERQADLFGAPPSLSRSATSRGSRSRKAAIETFSVEPDTVAAFAQRAGPADLDELVSVLADEALAHLALASARQLRRRLSRTAGGRQGRGAGRGRSALDRAGERLAAEWSAPPEEAW